MPKDTFYNLPDSKRRVIEDVAITEFANYGFDKASINRIVAGASIAKGSFYQYFEDKKDLFAHLIRYIQEEKLTFMSPVLKKLEGHDFFMIMEALYYSGLEFARQHPEAALIANQYYANNERSVLKEVYENNAATAKDFYGKLLDTAIASGEVRSGINRDFVIHMLISMSVSIFEYYFEYVQGKDFDMSRIDDDVMDTVRMSLDFIKNGIGVSNTGDRNDDKS